ncbi:hypothetical protein [Marinagarivorans algicola]|uniref:hypothetical protein n=1 Tax=Marinagarivorans algicola TaxID=1513270 RepID=UPI0012E32334|nr:hypothetical protein [Marinagarivorans algicola]
MPHTTPLINASMALLLYGSWAFYANIEHGYAAGLIAGSLQGIYAFGSTLCITLVALWVYKRCGGGMVGISAGFSLSFIVMLIIPWAVHSIADTPNKLQTVLPGIIWGSVYLMVILHQHAKK